MQPFKIAHLSDLHLGNDYVVRSLAAGRAWWGAEDPEIQASLAHSLRDLCPDYVVISGDIVNKSYPGSLTHAAATIRKLCRTAKIDLATQLLIIPGNHDVRVLPEESKYFARLQLFVEFLKDVFEEDNYRTRTERFLRLDVERRLCFLCLDTTLRNRLAIAEGIVGAAQWKWARRKVKELQSAHPDFRRFVKIVVLHHHPYPIVGDSREQFMQLEDAGEANAFFEEIGVQLVLHGHKHYPHVTLHPFPNKSHATIIGAGTACCPILAEQAGEGNSFNLIEVQPSANVLKVTRYKAAPNKAFVARRDVDLHPLFTPSEKGYKMREYRSHTRIKDENGNCEIRDQRFGLVADSAVGQGVHRIRFDLHGLPPDARIEDFTHSETVSEIVYETLAENRSRERRGAFVLKSPLAWGGDAVDFDSMAQLTRGFRMSAAQAGVEEMSVRVSHPTDHLTIIVDFPDKFPVRPETVFQGSNYEPVPGGQVAHELEVDPFTNRYTLMVRAPQLGHAYGLRWRLP
jgi:predicted phosphodiesterase